MSSLLFRLVLAASGASPGASWRPRRRDDGSCAEGRSRRCSFYFYVFFSGKHMYACPYVMWPAPPPGGDCRLGKKKSFFLHKKEGKEEEETGGACHQRRNWKRRRRKKSRWPTLLFRTFKGGGDHCTDADLFSSFLQVPQKIAAAVAILLLLLAEKEEDSRRRNHNRAMQKSKGKIENYGQLGE